MSNSNGRKVKDVEMNNEMETVAGNGNIEQVGITELNDLREGMEVMAVIKKIVNFGAFVDIGVGVDGLIHISKMSNEYVNDPADIVTVGEQVKVKVIGVDIANKKISLSMREDDGKPRTGGHREGGSSSRDSAPRRDSGRSSGGFSRR